MPAAAQRPGNSSEYAFVEIDVIILSVENAQRVVGALDAKRPFNITNSVNVATHVPLAPY